MQLRPTLFSWRHPVICWLPVIVALLPALGTTSSAAPAAHVRFAPGGYLIRDGRPRFVLGSYQLPADDAVLQQMVDAGINLVRVGPSKQTLDRVHHHGLSAWIPLGARLALPKGDARKQEALEQFIRKYKDHPALLCWEAPDEALWNVWYGRAPWVGRGQFLALAKHLDQAAAAQPAATVQRWRTMLTRAKDLHQRALWKQSEQIMATLWQELGVPDPHPDWKWSHAAEQARRLGDQLTRGWRVVRRVDPKHVLWQNHAPRNSVAALHWFNRAVDAAGCDIYPVPFNRGVGHSDLKDINLTAVGAYTDRMRHAAADKAVWMVLQGFGWKDLHPQDRSARGGRPPTLGETRFMAWDAIVHGANAVLYWGTHSIKNKKSSPLWRDLMLVCRQIRALEPAIVAPRHGAEPHATARETCGSIDGQGPRLMLRQSGDDWVLIAVNEQTSSLAFDVTRLPAELNGKTLYRLDSDESHIVRGAGFHDGIRSLDVQIYATSRRFQAP